MVSVALTTKPDDTEKIATTQAQFDQTSSAYTDVTGTTKTVTKDGFAGIRAMFKVNTGGFSNWGFKIVNVTTGAQAEFPTGTTLPEVFTKFGKGLIKVSIGDSIKMQVKSNNTFIVSIDANTPLYFVAPTNNLTDSFFLANVTSIKIWSAGAVDAINGGQPIKNDTDWTTISIDAIMNRFIWSANSGDVIWDWIGDKIGVTA